ncbi:MAG: hypothetical protein AUH13_28500 [Acidobacteria bacterium 13_2_20CM_58_27]|nr:MAG: hypothetical protein AUH13_28500 [Acidobacteria bacterium 13_2_20CM_58_27]
MASDITGATGRETAAALNTITTGIAVATATSAITIDMTSAILITIIAGTTDNTHLLLALATG